VQKFECGKGWFGDSILGEQAEAAVKGLFYDALSSKTSENVQ